MSLLKKVFLLLLLLLLAAGSFAQKKYTVLSPDRTIVVRVTVADNIYYELFQDGKQLVKSSAIAFKTDQNTSSGWSVRKATQTNHSGILEPVVWQKSKTVTDNYSTLHIDLKNGISLEWRVYDNGIAWRWIGNFHGAYKVLDEQAEINLGTEARSWYPQDNSFYSHNERAYKKYTLGELDSTKLADLPVLFDVQGTKLLLTESNLFNYAGMWVTGDGKGGVRATFPFYPKEKKITSDRDEKVISRENYIARVEEPQEFPWRILMVARADRELLTNQLPYLLGRPATGDYRWVRPGKVQWDWWHYNNIYDVNFRAGINNNTYKYYIDFAAKYHIEYVLLDEGWCDTRDLMKQSKDIDVPELAKYAKSKGVDILLWTSWLVLDKQLDIALDSFASWGIKGIKVDFMQRDDQDMVNYYEKVAKATAKRKMMVDFHGAYKPTGWSRTYPNVMTSEGVMGNEISKFAPSIDPEHTTTIPFIRMSAGPMDFTPGGMRNAQKKDFAGIPSEPMTLGTRCNQMAMYVVYESPLQMLCDMPTHYYQEPECMEFLKAVPSIWQQTVPLDGRVGDYVVVARQAADNRWFIGAMTNWTARELSLDFSFLGDGNYSMQVWKDGPNADRNAKDFATETITVNKSSKLPLHLSTGGGFVAILQRVDK